MKDKRAPHNFEVLFKALKEKGKNWFDENRPKTKNIEQNTGVFPDIYEVNPKLRNAIQKILDN